MTVGYRGIIGLTERAYRLRSEISDYLKRNAVYPKGIKASKLSEIFGISTRELRAIRQVWEIESTPALSDSATGYYYCDGIDGLLHSKSEKLSRVKRLETGIYCINKMIARRQNQDTKPRQGDLF